MRHARAPLAIVVAALLSAAPAFADGGPPDEDVGGAAYSLRIADFAASLFGGGSTENATDGAKNVETRPDAGGASDGQA